MAPQDGQSGGTWLAVRQDGAVLALLNHYPDGYSGRRGSRSRGTLIPALAGLADAPERRTLLASGLEELPPFRLLYLKAGLPAGRLFTWNGHRLATRHLKGRTGLLSSSSFRTKQVVAGRQAAFRKWQTLHPSGTLADLTVFHHATDAPRGPAWAVCMERPDARSVSLNTIRITPGEAAMTHQDACPAGPGFNPATSLLRMKIPSAP